MNCSHCQNPITQGSYFKDYWGNRYHAFHLKEGVQCGYCGRLVSKILTRGGNRYSDGRIICGICSSSAVTNPQEGAARHRSIVDSLAEKGIDVRRYVPTILLIDRKKLVSLSDRPPREEPGFITAKIKKVNGIPAAADIKIYLLKGLPRAYYASTLTHELMHLWLLLNGQEKPHPAMAEGACNYAAYLLLKNETDPLSAYIIHGMMQDKHKYYGKGFRKVLSLSQSKGHKHVLNYLKTHRRI